MITRLTILVQGATPQQRTGRVATIDDQVEPEMLHRAAALATRLGRVDQAWRGSSRAAHETAAALSIVAITEPALGELDLGRWTGRSLDEIAAEDPERLSHWLETGAAAAHGGETLDALLGRVSAWMALIGQRGGRHLAVTPAMVARAAIAHGLDGSAATIRRIDLDPLATVRLDGRAGRWSLRAIMPDRLPGNMARKRPEADEPPPA